MKTFDDWVEEYVAALNSETLNVNGMQMIPASIAETYMRLLALRLKFFKLAGPKWQEPHHEVDDEGIPI